MSISIKEAIKQIRKDNIVDVFKEKHLGWKEEDLNNLLSIGDEVSENVVKNPGKINLVVGQVQSGKTATYLSIISHLFDKGSNFILVAPATDNVLLQQTKTRLNDTFDGSRVCVISINDLTVKKELSAERIINAIKNDKKVILVTLKHPKRLKECSDILSIIRTKINLPLFLDDEGDQASFDNEKSSEDTAVFAEIKNIYSQYSPYGLSMLTVTASPMAHILVSENYAIKPDYAFYTAPGKEYIGIEEFMDDDKNYVVEIPSDDNENIIGTKGVLPESFRNAVLSFFVASALVHLKDGNYTTQSMLLHIDKHKQSHEKIEQLASNLVNNIILPKMQKKEKTYVERVSKIADSFGGIGSNGNLNDLIELIVEHMKNSEIYTVNGDTVNRNESVLDALYEPRRKNYIFIGSSMLQRGVTIKNLLHTYFSYRKNGLVNADTVLQRARWFGYRKNREFIRLFMPSKAIADFKSLASMVPDMNEKIVNAQKEGILFKELERSLYLPYAEMVGTRSSVVRNDRSRLSRFSANTKAVNSLVAEELFENVAKLSNTQKMMEEQSFYGCHFENFNDFKEWIGTKTFDELCKQVFSGEYDKKAFMDFIDSEKPEFFIANMVTDKTDFRIRKENEGTISIAQGHSENEGGYVGDRYWYKHPNGKFANAIILQLNKFKIRDTEKIIYKEAFVATNRIHGHFIHAVED